MSAQGVSVIHFETSEINTSLNTTNLLLFLTGIYTVVYFGTIYIYFKNSFKNHIVSAAITMLYVSNIVATATQWYATKWEFVDNGETRHSIFVSLSEGPQWTNIVYSASTFIVFVIADGLLIWRCFHVWNRSFRIISVPLLFIITETGLFLANIIFHIMYTNATLPSVAAGQTFNDVLSAAFFTSFFTTLATTTLIVNRIYSVSKDVGFSTTKFKHIIDIVVQSGAVYALTLLITAISNIIPDRHSDAFNARLYAFSVYIQAVNYPLAGMLATIMVARVTLSAKTALPSTIVHVSGLQFRARSTHHPGTTIDGTGGIHSFDIERVSIVENKVQ